MKLKLTRTGKRRLEKLCTHLDQRPRRLFDFSAVVEKRKCGTVGCAIGCTPEVFPKLVRYYGHTVVNNKNGIVGYGAVASELFGIPFITALHLFAPSDQHAVSVKLNLLDKHATPKQVARMLRHFIALTEKGEIEV